MKRSEYFRQPALVLVILNSQKGNITTTKLAKDLKVYYGNMFKIIKRLEKFNLVKKETIRNKREIKIVLTKKGKKLAEKIQKVKQALN